MRLLGKFIEDNTIPFSKMVNLTGSANDILIQNASGDVVASSILSTSLVIKDVNNNLLVNSIAEGVATTVTAAGTTTLTVASAPNQQFTGATTQTVVLPDATTLNNGTTYLVLNRSTGIITVDLFGGGVLSTVGPGDSKSFTLFSNGTSAGTWDFKAGSGAASGISGSVQYSDGSGGFSSDATNFFWDATNKGLKVGGGSTVAAQTQPYIYIASSTTTVANAGLTHENASASTQGGLFTGRKARGSLASPAAIVSGDTITSIIGFGYGTSYQASSDISMTMTATETFTGSAHGTQFNFLTTNNGSVAKRTIMQLTPGGSLAMMDNTGATQQLRINATGGQTMPSGTSATTSVQALVATQNLGIWTANNAAGNSADLRVETGTATGTRGNVVLQSLRWPNADGTSGQALVTDGAGVLSFATVSGGGGANTALSNLASVLINVSDFVFNAGADTTIHTRDVSGTSDNFVFRSGNSSAANSGSVDIRSGAATAVNQNTGQVSLRSFDAAGAAGTGVSGQVSVYTGSTTNGNSGNLGLVTGNSSGANSGLITIATGTAGGSRGQIRLQNGTEGTSGWVWTSIDGNGSGEWMPASGGGANVFLSNLTSPTAINQDLIFAKASPAIIKTQDSAVAISANLFITTGTTTGFDSGVVAVFSADPTGGNSGSVGLSSGSPQSGGFNSGDVSVNSGSASGAGGTGRLLLWTGTVSNGASGDVWLQPGTVSGVGTRGKIRLADGSEGTAGYVWTSIDTEGRGEWVVQGSGSGANNFLSNLTADTAINEDLIFDTGVDARLKTKDESATSSKNLYVITGDASGANDSGELLLQTGLGQSSGSLSILTGNTTAADFNSGTVMVSTGAPTGIGVSGSIITTTGDSVDGNSGVISLTTGQTTGAGTTGALTIGSGVASGSGGSGNVIIKPGNTNSGLPGDLSLITADSVSNGAGNLFITTGTGVGGQRGSINISNGTEGFEGQVLTTVDSGGGAAWIAPNYTKIRVIIGSSDTLSATTDFKVILNDNTAGTWTLNLPPGVDRLSFVISAASANNGTWTLVPNGGDILDSPFVPAALPFTVAGTNMPLTITFSGGVWYHA